MALGGSRLMGWYFDRVYNPVYDLTTARTSAYRRSQRLCVEKMGIREGGLLLCLGVGTGNEVMQLLNSGTRVGVMGVDISRAGLRRTANKAGGAGRGVGLARMDAQCLGFSDEAFDGVFSHHVLGFLEDDSRAVQESVRVLRTGGHFVFTFPSGSGWTVLVEIGRAVLRSLRSGRLRDAVVELAAVVGGGIVNVPVAFWLRPKNGYYSRGALESFLAESGLEDYEIEEDRSYQNLIVHGRKV